MYLLGFEQGVHMAESQNIPKRVSYTLALQRPKSISPLFHSQVAVVVRLMDFKQGLNRTKNTPIVRKAKFGIKLKVIMSSFISRLSSGQKSVASYCKWGDNSIPYDKRNSPLYIVNSLYFSLCSTKGVKVGTK